MRYGETSHNAETEFEDDVEELQERYESPQRKRANGTCPPPIDYGVRIPRTDHSNERALSQLARFPESTNRTTRCNDTTPVRGYLPDSRVIMGRSTLPRTEGLPRIGILGGKKRKIR